MKLINKFLGILLGCVITTQAVFAESRSMDFVIVVPSFMQILSVTSPVLTANITDRTGNLYAPLTSRFRVITNKRDTQTLYLKANTVTESGYEEAMFMQGGRVYIAFASLKKIPTSSSLANAKISGNPSDSPGVVAYPISSIIGAEHKYDVGKNKYEVYVPNGTTDIAVNVGSNVLKNTFGANDPKGFYQAVLSLTEVDM